MRKPSTCLLITAVTLLTVSCGHNNAGGTIIGGGGGNPQAISGITADNAELLTRSSLEMISKVLVIGNIATRMIEIGLPILSDHSQVIDIPECPGGSTEANQISYLSFSPGFNLPPGDALHVALQDCQLENFLVTGFMDLAGLTVDTAGAPSQWHYGSVFQVSLTFLNTNNTYTWIGGDPITYSAVMSNGVLTTTLRINPSTAPQGGLNASGPCADANNCPGPTDVNFQIRPFYMVAVDDSNNGHYTVSIGPDPNNQPSVIDRYTQSPNAEILLRTATTGDNPILWTNGRPALYTDVPASGELQLTQTTCGACWILATVNNTGVTLTVSSGGSMTTKSSDWTTLLSTPE